MIVALDLETTWVNKELDKIIEVALVKFDEKTFEIIDTFSTLINPWMEIPEIISNITNIFDKDVKDAPYFWESTAIKIKEFIQDCPILWHNTYFDRDFLMRNWVDLEQNIVLDTFVLSNIILIEEKSLNLWAISESLQIEFTWAHRALNDVIATIEVFKNITFKFRELDFTQKKLLNYIFSVSNHKSFGFYRDYFEFPKEIITSEDFVKDILSIIKKYDSNKVLKVFDTKIDEVKDIFDKLPDFEVRENQLSMSKIIDETLKTWKKSVIEAPTWVWKTFAYLIPSINYSLKTASQIVISTNTKALQDQIYYKDLAFLSKNLWFEFAYSKLKWRKNYFSVSMFFQNLFYQDILDLDETWFYSKIVYWLFKTEFWELEELNFYQKEYQYLKHINADHFLVLSDQNEYKFYEHIFKARSDAQNSNIVVVNHSLLLQDIGSTTPIFGQITNLIIDESHNLEDSTTDALKKSFSINSLFETFSKIKNILNKNSYILDNLDNYEKNLWSMISLVFDLLCDYANKKNTYSNDVFDVLIENDFFLQNPDINTFLNNIEIQYIDFTNLFATVPDKLFLSLKSELWFLEEMIFILKTTLANDLDKYIPIFNFNKNYNHQLIFTLLNPWNYLKTNLWEKLDSVVLTSATLRVWNEYNYIKNILNLNSWFDFHTLQSDFDYSKQALLFVPNDLWSVKFNNPRINDFVLKFIEIVWWNTLVLLTSFNSIKDLYLHTNIPLKSQNINVLAQSLAWSKHKVANYFKNHADNSVILWTDSFWEWVDIPWDDLKYLIIHKFPFLVPTDPIFKARSRLFTDAFREYSIPKSIIKTKQWFWRLIRTKNDNWIVILLDDRYYSTNWWAMMRSSFPDDINIKFWDSKTFLELMKQKTKKA